MVWGCAESQPPGAGGSSADAGADPAEGEGEGEGEGAGTDAGDGNDSRVISDPPDVATLNDFGSPCEEGNECRSGYCLQAEDGLRCSAFCRDQSDCPDGWLCLADHGVGEATLVCFPDRYSLCEPCQTHDGCEGQGARCMGIGRGSYCGRPCHERYACPEGYRCAELLDDLGAVIDRQCKPNDGRCGQCIDEDGDDYGIGLECLGEDCDDQDPFFQRNACGGCERELVEVCNGEDDDCDGQVDNQPRTEDWLVQDCSTVCGEGTETCLGGAWLNCGARQPLPEICGDGVDNDCEGGEQRSPDVYEPNNECAQAAEVPGGRDPDTTLYPSFDSIEDSDDWFRFQGNDTQHPFSSEEIKVDLLRSPPGVELRLTLYHDGCNNVIANQRDCGGHPCIRWEEGSGDDDGTYYIRVERLNDGFECLATYELAIDGLD